MTRNVFHDREDAAVHQTLDLGPGEIDDGDRIAREGAIADHAVGTFHRQIEDRYAVDIDADLGQVVGDQPRIQIASFGAGLVLAGVNEAEASGWWTLLP